jgi:hypothetical protein
VSGDELFVLLLSGMLALVLWTKWFGSLVSVHGMASGIATRLPVLVAPWICASLLFTVLRRAAAHDVRDDPKYLFFYQMMGAAWVAVAVRFLPRLGVSARDDVVERRNASAAAAFVGAVVGLTLCFAGSNIGDGPGWWCVAFTGALATAAFFGAWTFLERRTAVAESVAVERDLASGVRLGAWLVAMGLVVGRAAAGNWTGPVAATLDFARVGWPAAVLTLLAVVAEPLLRPTAERPRPSVVAAGVFPGLLHLGLALAWVVFTRPWS